MILQQLKFFHLAVKKIQIQKFAFQIVILIRIMIMIIRLAFLVMKSVKMDVAVILAVLSA